MQLKQHIIYAFISLFFISELSAQGERDNWYFGQLAGMTFDGNNLTSLNDNTIERRIVFGMIEGPDNIICANDADGNLCLLYTSPSPRD